MSLKFSIARKTVPVILEGEAGVELKYSLREMTGEQLSEYSTKASERYKTDSAGGVAEIKDFRGIYSLLLSYTLYDAAGNLVPVSEIEQWPHTVQRLLMEEASKLNGFRDADAESEKKS